MKDTTEAIDTIYREMLMKRSGAERLRMGAAMSDAARSLARAGLRAQADCSEADMRARLFVRFYGSDFSAVETSRIVAHLRATPSLSIEKQDVERAIERDVPDELLRIVIGVSQNAPDLEWAQAMCVELSRHPHFNVRGNAVLGLGHLARRFGGLDERVVKPIIEAALRDADDYVRGQADTAADDIRQSLRWQIEEPLADR